MNLAALSVVLLSVFVSGPLALAKSPENRREETRKVLLDLAKESAAKSDCIIWFGPKDIVLIKGNKEDVKIARSLMIAPALVFCKRVWNGRKNGMLVSLISYPIDSKNRVSGATSSSFAEFTFEEMKNVIADDPERDFPKY